MGKDKAIRAYVKKICEELEPKVVKKASTHRMVMERKPSFCDTEKSSEVSIGAT